MFLNARGDFAWDGELLQFRQWLEDVVVVRRWVPFRTEWSIFDDVHLIAGQIDSLWLDPQGSIVFTLILTVCLTVCALCFSLLGLALVYPSANDSGFRTLLSGYALNSKTVDEQGKQAHVQSHTHTHTHLRGERGVIHMVDWKRCRDGLSAYEGARWGRCGHPPVDDMIDNKFSHYALQQLLFWSLPL